MLNQVIEVGLSSFSSHAFLMLSPSINQPIAWNKVTILEIFPLKTDGVKVNWDDMPF